MNKRKNKKTQTKSVRQMNAYLISKCMARDRVIEQQTKQIAELITLSEAVNICVVEAFGATEVNLSLDKIKCALNEKKLIVEVDEDTYTMRVEEKVCDTQEASTEI